jgi:WhiB family redox-sensing transcriptional regulator
MSLDELLQRPDWQTRAACRGMGPDVFFRPAGDNAGTQAAKQICAGCPVQAECLDFAIGNVEQHGVWGGTTERARRPMRVAAGGGKGRRPAPVWLVCAACAKSFQAYRRDAETCSRACQVWLWRHRTGRSVTSLQEMDA